MTTVVRGLAFLILCSTPSTLWAQSKSPSQAVDITKEDIDAVLKHAGNPGGGADRQIKVVDLGPYNLGVGILRRGPTTPGAPVSGISHTQVTEVYYIISGGGTLITGGALANPQAYGPTVEFVQVAVGPSLGGAFQGGERRVVKAGDVVIIPAGVPHGFDNVKDHVLYLSVRPDPDRVLPAGYVHPALTK